jgi:peroxiredoxin
MKKILPNAVLAVTMLLGTACATSQSAAPAAPEAKATPAAPAAAAPAAVAAPGAKPFKVEAPAAAAAPTLADKAGVKVPAWTAQVVGGEVLSSDKLKGKAYGLVFVNNSCASCRAELADMLSMKFRADFTLYVAAVDARLDRAVLTYRDEMKVTYPILDDSKFKLASVFNIASTPAAIIVDKDGKIEYWGTGYTAQTQARTTGAFEKYFAK